MDGDGRVRETCDELLDVADTLDSAEGCAEGGAVPEVQVHTVKTRVRRQVGERREVTYA